MQVPRTINNCDNLTEASADLQEQGRRDVTMTRDHRDSEQQDLIRHFFEMESRDQHDRLAAVGE